MKKPTKAILNHKLFDLQDYEHLQAKGYTNKEISALWDRDLIGRVPASKTSAAIFEGKKAAFNTLSSDISKGDQSVLFKETLNYGAKKVRIEIKSDAYEKQCFARVSLWDGEKWNRIDFIPSSKMNTEDKLAYQPGNKGLRESNFSADRKILLKLAADVIDHNTGRGCQHDWDERRALYAVCLDCGERKERSI